MVKNGWCYRRRSTRLVRKVFGLCDGKAFVERGGDSLGIPLKVIGFSFKVVYCC